MARNRLPVGEAMLVIADLSLASWLFVAVLCALAWALLAGLIQQ